MRRKKCLFILTIVLVLTAVLLNAASARIVFCSHILPASSTLRPLLTAHTKILNNLFKNNNTEKNIDRQLKGYVNGENIGFLTFRANTEAKDGVTLEMLKWMHVFFGLGANIYCLSGETDMPDFVKGETFKPMHFRGRIKEDFALDAGDFGYTTMLEAGKAIYGTGHLSDKSMAYLMQLKDLIKKKVISYIKDNNISIVIAENIVYPGNPSFSLACMEALEEIEKEGKHKIDFKFFHNHDYWKERIDRGVPNGTGFVYKVDSMNLIDMYDEIKQGMKKGVVLNINTFQEKYVPAEHIDYIILTPNVMPFEGDSPSTISATEKNSFRRAFEIPDNAIIFITPSRIVKRKNLLCAVDIAYEVQELKNRPVYIILTHPAGDEGFNDLEELKEHAQIKNIHLIDVSKKITKKMGFPLGTAYHVSDIVIYPSDWEGYGNVFPEACYYGNIIAARAYPVLKKDIAPTGIHYIEIKEPLNGGTIAEIVELLNDNKKREEIIRRNYRIGKKEFSYLRLKKDLLEGFKRNEQLKRANARAAKLVLPLPAYPASGIRDISSSIRKNAVMHQAIKTAA
jgi:glycosyltransferase involved in cell wall biosynthesis